MKLHRWERLDAHLEKHHINPVFIVPLAALLALMVLAIF